jgi:hypothetical protein
MRLWCVVIAVVAAICAVAAAGEPKESGTASESPVVMEPRTDMQLDNARGVYYKHVMKTGGTTMDEMLWLATKTRSIEYRTSESRDAPLPSPNEAPEFIKIVTLREPVSRVISHYWQVKPWGNYSGGSDRHCRYAAAIDYDRYLLRCQFARNWQSRYFSPTMLAGANLGAFLRQAFDLVILSEFYDAGIIVLHYKFGFTVNDLLYIFRKTRQPRPLQLTDQQMYRTIAANRQDARLYREAQTVWAETMREVLDVDRFHRALKSYKQLIHAYNNFMEPLATQQFVVEARQDPAKWQQLVQMKNAFCELHPRCRFNNLLFDV